MPLVPIFRYAAPAPARTASTSGTQYVTGELAFEGATTINLSASVYAGPGLYVLFSYGTFPMPSQLSNVTVNFASVPNVDSVTLEDDYAYSRVLMYLNQAPTVGTQYVDGDLTFTVPTTITMDAALYLTFGTYVLFEVTGSITGEGLVTATPPAGFTASTVYKSGNQLKVLLS